MALKEFDAALADYKEERNSESIQHAQQCVERIGKSILSFLGFSPEKTHHPSNYIVKEILQNPDVIKSLELNEDEIKYLVDIATLSSPFERQGNEIASVMMKNAFQLLIKSCEFYRLRDMDEILATKILEIDEYVKKHGID